MPGAGVKILNKRIRSVKNTQQITKAMKMVAAAKLQRSQGRMLAARPYSQKLTELMAQLSRAAEAEHPLFEQRPVKRRLYVLITSDKGLCGAYNMNLIKLAKKKIDASVADGIETEIYAIGKNWIHQGSSGHGAQAGAGHRNESVFYLSGQHRVLAISVHDLRTCYKRHGSGGGNSPGGSRARVVR